MTNTRLWQPMTLSRVLWTTCLSLFIVTMAYADAYSPKKYPPYPDVWHWLTPHPERIDTVSFNLLPLNNGDVLIVYTEAVPMGKQSKGVAVAPGSADEKIGALAAKVSGKKSKSKTREVLHQITFFGGQRVVKAKSNVRILRGQETDLELDDGTIVRVLPPEETGKTGTGWPTLTGGERIGFPKTYDTWGLNALQSRVCYNGPGRHSLTLSVKSDDQYVERKTVAAVTIFKILNKPMKVRVTDKCTYELAQAFTTRVDNPPVHQVFPLSDGTFLAEIDTGVLMRFDAQLNTKSRLVNDKYFPLNWNVNLGQRYLHKLTGKNYNPPGESEYYDFQPMVDDIYQHLIELKGSAKK